MHMYKYRELHPCSLRKSIIDQFIDENNPKATV